MAVLLPDETYVQIFSYLGIKDLLNCQLVNTSWRRIASDNCLWKRLVPSADGLPSHNIQEHMIAHMGNSNEAIIEYINQFEKAHGKIRKSTIFDHSSPDESLITPMTYIQFNKRRTKIRTLVIKVLTFNRSGKIFNLVKVRIIQQERPFTLGEKFIFVALAIVVIMRFISFTYFSPNI